jgi:hypothetical protein
LGSVQGRRERNQRRPENLLPSSGKMKRGSCVSVGRIHPLVPNTNLRGTVFLLVASGGCSHTAGLKGDSGPLSASYSVIFLFFK